MKNQILPHSGGIAAPDISGVGRSRAGALGVGWVQAEETRRERIPRSGGSELCRVRYHELASVLGGAHRAGSGGRVVGTGGDRPGTRSPREHGAGDDRSVRRHGLSP